MKREGEEKREEKEEEGKGGDAGISVALQKCTLVHPLNNSLNTDLGYLETG